MHSTELQIEGDVDAFDFGEVTLEIPDEASIQKAADLIRDFKDMRRSRNTQVEGTGDLSVDCENCGKTGSFPGSLDGTTQECRHSGAYVDVGGLPWEDDFGESDD